MPITKNSSRQDVAAAVVDFSYADLTSGAFAAAIELPRGAMITGGEVRIDTAFNSGTSDTMTVGVATSAAKYGTGFNVHAAGSFLLTGLGQTEANKVDLGITWTGAGAVPTAGAGKLIVLYIEANKAEFSQG